MAARRRFLLDINQVATFCTNFELLDESLLTGTLLGVKLQELERRYSKLVTTYESYCIDEENEQDKKEAADVSKDRKFEETSDLYQECKAKIQDLITKKVPHVEEAQIVPRQSTSVRLPTVDIQPFEGGYSKWPIFRDLFNGVFAGVSSGQKLAHLHNKTKGEAREIVARFEIVDANFDLAWKALKDRYENPRILVHQQMKKLFGIQATQLESSRSLRQIQSGINDSLAIFTSYKVDVKNWDPFVIYLCSSKIPEDTLRAWEDYLTNHKELPTWKQMDEFLTSRIEKLETVQDFKRPSQREHQHTKSQNFYTQEQQEQEADTCPKCKQRHLLWKCKEFKTLSVNDRIKFAMSNKCCLNCLSPTHFKPKCTSTRFCKICKKSHHTLLHIDQKNNRSFRPHQNENPHESANSSHNFASSTQPNTAQNQIERVNTHFSQTEGATILPTALIYLTHSGELFSVRALLDSGSEKSFISSRIQQKLSLPLKNHQTQISGLGGTVVSSSKGKCDVTLKSRVSNFKICIKVIVVSTLSQFLPSRPIRIGNLEEIKDITLADPYFCKPAPIDMIIGSDFLPFIHLRGSKIIEGCLEARESHFGWYLSGPAPPNQVKVFTTSVTVNENMALHDQLKKFWETEEVEKPKTQSDCDIYCEQLFRSTTYRGPDGKYVVRLPFKEQYPHEIFLGPSKHIALAQYCRMEKTLAKTPQLKEQYQAVLQEYEDLNHMAEVPNTDQTTDQVSNFFLPHHAVVRPESVSTKVRVVFNASKKTKSGFSLNDALYSGPILQADIVQVITNWRLYQFVFTGDIQKMYRQIWVHPEDIPYQQILFRRSPDQAIKPFQLKTVTFGVNCAPFLAIRTLHELSKDVKHTHPQAALTLKNEVYVDDILSGGHCVQGAKIKQNEIISALSSAGFPIKKVTANHPKLLKHLPREDLLSEEFLKIDDSSVTKTLGVKWNALSDYFCYAIETLKINPSITKREMLSIIAKLFDPLGWIGPVIIIAKMFMQELWEIKSDWDEDVPPHLLSRWNMFLTNLHHLSTIKIPRWLNFNLDCCIQLHGFCDASEKAYCGAVYLRILNPTGEIKSHLLIAKTRVSPIKKTTIPKLELCGAVLLTKLMNNITINLKFQHEVFFWTDSAIVLGWLQKPPQTLKTFVANRVGEIVSAASVSQWKHVKSDENPSDLGSRGCIPHELATSHLWWHGPIWLQLPQKEWPKPRTFDPCNLEMKKTVTFFTEINQEEIILNFSSLERCLRVVGYLFKFFNASRGKPFNCKNQNLDVEEIEFAKKRLISISQKTSFSREIECLRKKIPINRKSKILTLNSFLDEHGLLRVGGRLNNSEMGYDERHPIIIPEKSHLAKLLVNFTHTYLLHAEFHGMIRAIRQGYYIPRLKNLVRKCVRECKACTIYKHKSQQQLMAALPPERVKFSLPFTYTGVDFAGPFNLKSSTLRNAKIIKGYAAVFVCFSTKAVHLETCSDLSADAFIAAFTRFTGRRGLPKTMFSDNGRNFVGASYKMLKEHNAFLKSAEKAIYDKYSLHGFKWSFIPPYAPHMGGLWEAAVKSMKTHLKKISLSINYTFEEFTTLLVRVEAILNSRPLSAISQNPQELLPLTPGHFLRGAPIITAPEGPAELPLKKLSHLKRWEKLKAIQNHFAHRWKNEYITELQRRNKWKTTKTNLKENDLVIVKDDLLPPTEWRLGRVMKLHPGKDNNVRVADILTQNGTITRPLVKLCLLPNVWNTSTEAKSA